MTGGESESPGVRGGHEEAKHEEIEIQITPMLDMAFQLLTFFILTYRPAPSEGQFALNLLPAQKVIDTKAEAPPDPKAGSDIDPALKTVTTKLRAGGGGELAGVTMGDNDVPLNEIPEQLKKLYKNPDLPFDQALIQVDPKLKYSELMKIINYFSEAEVTKISFAELEGGGN